MTETATEAEQEPSDVEETVGEPSDSEATEDGSSWVERGGKLSTYLVWGAVAVLFVLAVVATAGLYSSVGRVIDIWIAPDYQPVFRAAFNLAVVLACVAGLSVLVRRLDTDRL
ncbi:MAG: hypothetical protein BRD23_05530 [Halobacteriales archaeon SW_9_67_25]|jgi:hypothetical protein|nr:MAG: hypothetical protein BRD23_05530 [Halobacteriales archaeon SW_9_67_25]